MKPSALLSTILFLLPSLTTASTLRPSSRATTDICLTDPYKTLLTLIGNDPTVQTFCSALPTETKLDRNKCPKALKSLAYNAIVTFCNCVKTKCIPPTTCDGTLCPQQPCGKKCVDTEGDVNNCGGCGKACPSADYTCYRSTCYPPCVKLNQPCGPAAGGNYNCCSDAGLCRRPEGGDDSTFKCYGY